MADKIITKVLRWGGDKTAAQLAASNLVYKLGQWVFERDTGRIKRGDGTTVYNLLPYRFEFESGARKISIPTDGNPDYPDATLTQDGFSYTITFGETISGLLGGFEPQITLIKNGTQVQIGAVYFQFTGKTVTAAILDGMYSGDDVNVKVNFLA